MKELSEICSHVYRSPLGNIWVAGTESGLTDLRFCDAQFQGGDPPARLLPVCLWLDAYFAGEKPDFGHIRLAPRGTEFQHRVWKAMLDIPYGTTTTYGHLARQLGTSPRAIGGAASRNPLFILVPCHRVIGTDGQIKGYAGGISHKKWLLAHEGWHYSPPTTNARG